MIAGLFAACAISSVLRSADALRSARGRPCRGAECVGARVPAEGMGARTPAAGPEPTLSALCFTLALAAKVTSLAIPVAAVAGLLVAGRHAAGHRRVMAAPGWRRGFLALVHWTSDGRAIESWRACMFAGTDAGGTFGSVLDGDFLRMTRYSHLLKALLAAGRRRHCLRDVARVPRSETRAAGGRPASSRRSLPARREPQRCCFRRLERCRRIRWWSGC